MDELILKTANKYGLDPNLVRAMIHVESSGNPLAIRFEPHYYAKPTLHFTREYASRLRLSHDTERMLQSCSFGLLQIMGVVARELGYDGELLKLLQPDIGLEYGCKKLKKLFEKYGVESDVISAYNRGSPFKTKGGFYENEDYVNKVYKELRKLRALKE